MNMSTRMRDIFFIRLFKFIQVYEKWFCDADTIYGDIHHQAVKVSYESFDLFVPWMVNDTFKW